VACATQTTCAALDSFGEAFTWVAGRWSGPYHFDPALMDGDAALSCPSASFCMVVDGLGEMTTWNGRAWTPATRIDGVDSGLADVSCATGRLCIAVDDVGRVLTYR
jgi:hypothetical protein